MMDETQGQICDRKYSQSRMEGRRGDGWAREGMGVCVNDMVICTLWSSDVIKAMI